MCIVVFCTRVKYFTGAYSEKLCAQILLSALPKAATALCLPGKFCSEALVCLLLRCFSGGGSLLQGRVCFLLFANTS